MGWGKLPSTLQSRRRDHKEGNLPAPNSSLSPDNLGSTSLPADAMWPRGARSKVQAFQGCPKAISDTVQAAQAHASPP